MSLRLLYKSAAPGRLSMLSVSITRSNYQLLPHHHLHQLRRHLSMEKNQSFDVSAVGQSLTYYRNKQLEAKNNNNGNRTLVVIFAWMLANDNHLEKFRQFYSNYNFDVVTMKTTLWQLLFPKNGSVENARELCDFIVDHKQLYSNVLVHGFSVGGYQFGEVLVHMTKNENYRKTIAPLIRGCIFDSAANLNGTSAGLAKALTTNRLLRRVIFVLSNLHLRIFYNISTVYYEESEKEFEAMRHFKVPNLVFVSDVDTIGSIEANQPLVDRWGKQSPSRMKIFKGSKHVSHYYQYKEEYERDVNEFIEKLKLSN